MILNIVLYIMIAYMVINIFRSSRNNRQNKLLVGVINSIQDQDEFFRKADELIESAESALYINKGKVLKLWGAAYHNKDDMFREVLNDLNPEDLIIRQKGSPSIISSEDSFFYLFLAIPNILEAKGKRDLRELLGEKMTAVAEELKNQMVVLLSAECDKYYRNEADRGMAFYEKVLEGDYEGVDYSKNLIGLYKMICSAMAAKLYEEEGNTEKYEEMMDMVRRFAETGVGQRWLAGIGLHVEAEKEVTAEEENTAAEEPVSEDTAEEEASEDGETE